MSDSTKDITMLMKEGSKILKKVDDFKKKMLSNPDILFSSLDKSRNKKTQGGGAFQRQTQTQLRRRTTQSSKQNQQLTQYQRNRLELGLSINSNTNQSENERFKKELLETVTNILSQVNENAQTLNSVEDIAIGIDQTTNLNQSKIQNMHKDLKKGFADLKSQMAKDSSCIANPSVILGILTTVATLYYEQGDLSKVSMDSFGPTVIGAGAAATFFRCLITILLIVFKILMFIINTYITINKFIYQIYSTFGNTWPIIGIIITFCGLVLQISINLTLIKLVIATFGCEYLWEDFTKKLLPIVGTYLGKAYAQISKMLSSSDGIFEALFEVLDPLIPDEFLSDDNPNSIPIKGRFMIFFKSLIFLPFKLIGYLICHSLCGPDQTKIPYLGISLADILGCKCDGLVGGSTSVKSLKFVKSSKKGNSKVITLFKRENSFDKKLDKQLGNLVGLLITHNSAADRLFADPKIRQNMNEKFNNIISACMDTANYSVDTMLVLSNIVKKMPQIKSKMAGKMFSTTATRTPTSLLRLNSLPNRSMAVFGKRSKRTGKNKVTRKRRSSSKRNKKNQSRRRKSRK